MLSFERKAFSHRSAFKAPHRAIQNERTLVKRLVNPTTPSDLKLEVFNASNQAQVSRPGVVPIASHQDVVFSQRYQSLRRNEVKFHPYMPFPPQLQNFGMNLQLPQYQKQMADSFISLQENTNFNESLSVPQNHTDTAHFSIQKTHPSQTALPKLEQLSPENPFGISLPSDREPLDLLPQAYFANKSQRGHLCLYCGKLYSRKYGLKIHMRTHNGYKPLKCKICSRPFGDPSNLNKHVRLHAQGDTPYRCEFCGKVLVRRRDLDRHIKSRHPGEAGRSGVELGELEEDGDDARDEEEDLSPGSSPISVTSHEDETEASNTP